MQIFPDNHSVITLAALSVLVNVAIVALLALVKVAIVALLALVKVAMVAQEEPFSHHFGHSEGSFETWRLQRKRSKFTVTPRYGVAQ